MKWREHYELWDVDGRAAFERARLDHEVQKANEELCFDCMAPKVLLRVVKERYGAVVHSRLAGLHVPGLPGATSCTRCKKPRTLLPREDEDEAPDVAREDFRNTLERGGVDPPRMPDVKRIAAVRLAEKYVTWALERTNDRGRLSDEDFEEVSRRIADDIEDRIRLLTVAKG